jgi:hypothetical protein
VKKVTLLLFVFLVKFNFSQNSGKTHFIIHAVDVSTDLTKYQNAASNWAELDKFRLLDKRRTIYFSDMKASIELISAQELLDTYGKQISPLTIKTETYPNITFDVSMDGKSLKPQLISK